MIAANLISRFGDSVDAIAYSWMVYQLTGSTAWLSVILGVNMIPTVLFQPLGGGLTEYFRKKRVIVICDIARGAVVFLTGVCMLTGVLRPWHLLIFTFVNSSIEALRIPNGLAILPQILKKENYKAAISMDQGADRDGLCRDHHRMARDRRRTVCRCSDVSGIRIAAFIFTGE